ncbi:rhodanese-like domain-containing protein [Atopomonas sediminilitoris]|uniref:rhodanese-like domain-containing protein n=1 Tax=Atopomonas sediminilitoris TaxID=2919919 RepID=UPI001F4DD8BC|nr:rhodanese-like domain-containing protein [Atopomonas sediminilitoris]MCJ8168053.1 rhodanese-like domain-containing protein [Atopomonas sediminilitoris]
MRFLGILLLLGVCSGALHAADLISAEQLSTKPAALLLDVRSPNEYAAGHIPGAHNISHEQLAARLNELSAYQQQPVVVYCHSGARTRMAISQLEAAGFSQVLHLQGDFIEWRGAGRPVVMGDAP